MWVERIVAEGNDIALIQNLRNWIMTANFLASTSILVVGLLGAALSSSALSTLSSEINVIGSSDPRLVHIKVLLLVIAFLFAFLHFSICLRSLTHTSFMTAQGAEGAVAELDKGAFHYTVGVRSYYAAIPLGLWFFGPLWLLLGTVALIAMLCVVDA